jgi:hypothetical protein
MPLYVLRKPWYRQDIFQFYRADNENPMVVDIPDTIPPPSGAEPWDDVAKARLASEAESVKRGLSLAPHPADVAQQRATEERDTAAEQARAQDESIRKQAELLTPTDTDSAETLAPRRKATANRASDTPVI